MAEGEGSGSIRFGPFELSLETHELSKHGIRLRLHGQPIQVLELLVARPGKLVTREELMQKLWPNESFGDFEHGLNAAVNKLRETLGDSATVPIYIETVAGRGYRFISTLEPPKPGPPPPPPPAPPGWLRAVVVVALIAVITCVGYWWWHRIDHHEPVWALVSDFDSYGGDVPFPDGMVREALAVDLQQSQYVNVFSRNQIQQILRRMGKPPDTRIDENTGREVCLRSNLRCVVLIGSIVNSGSVSEIAVKAVDPEGTVFLFEKEGKFKRDVFSERIDALARRVRRDLGESANGVKASSRPLAEVTTPSVEALELYSQAADAMDQGRLEQALALLLSALERDPDFAMAHHLIADVYEIMGNRTLRRQHLERAYDDRARLTPRESYLVEASYAQASDQPERAVDALTALVALYPLDAEARGYLGSAYYDLGRLKNAIQQLKEVIKIDPESAPTYGYLVEWLARDNAPEEAVATYKKAQARGLEVPGALWGLGMALWNQGKVAEAQAQFKILWESGSAYATVGRIYFARTLIYQGKLAAASKHLAAGIPVDQVAGNKAPELLERYLLAAVAQTQGKAAQARHHLELMQAPRNVSALEAVDLQRAGALYAEMGDLDSARQILERLKEISARQPGPYNRAHQYNLEGEISLAEARSADAEQQFLASLAAYPLALSHQGLARTYEAQEDWENAATEWKSFLNSRGEVFQDNCPVDWVRGYLSLARVDLHVNNIEESRAEYGKLLEIWGNGDQVGLVQQAVSEAQEAMNRTTLSRPKL